MTPRHANRQSVVWYLRAKIENPPEPRNETLLALDEFGYFAAEYL